MPRPRSWRAGVLALAAALSLAWVVLSTAVTMPTPVVSAASLVVAGVAGVATIGLLSGWLRHGQPGDLLGAAGLALLGGGLVADGFGAAALPASLAGGGALLALAGVLPWASLEVERQGARLGLAVVAFGAVEAALILILLAADASALATAALPLTLAGAVCLATGATAAVLATATQQRDAPVARTGGQRLPDFVQAASDGAFLFDGRLRLRDWNVAGGELLGAGRVIHGARLEDLLGVTMAELRGSEGWIPVAPSRPGAAETLEVRARDHEDGMIVLARDPLGPPMARLQVDRMGHELRGTIEELMQARRTVALQRAEIERAATVDAMTGVTSRAAILERLALEVAQARRYPHPVAIALLDVDGFSAVNRRHGLEVGDAVLREVALRMRLRVRAADALGRSGGDAFLAILPHTDETGAANFADALRQRLAQRPVTTAGGTLAITVSVGVAVMRPGEDLDADTLIGRADEALASARGAGGDRIALDRLQGVARLEARDGEEPDAPSANADGTQDSGA
ncbi:MAG: GGDEF domain-containing protein [Candidatus Limnocylindria bacterium]